MLTNSNINKIAVHWKYSVAVLAITSGISEKAGYLKSFSYNKYCYVIVLVLMDHNIVFGYGYC